MEVIIFIAVIVVLIVVHEFGHLVAAKLSGMRVDEFGLGYPPRAAVLGRAGETLITLNWLPFGGFVKIYGEDGSENAADPRAFGARPRILQAFVLVAGVAMNLLFAYVLITGALVAGTPRALTANEAAQAKDVQLAVANVLPGTPAADAGLLAGDTLLSGQDANGSWQDGSPQSFTAFVESSGGEPISLTVKGTTGGERTVSVTPAAGIVPGDASRYALGVEVASVGVLPVSFWSAFSQGAVLTWGVVTITASGLWHFFAGIFTLHANLAQVAGPIGIAGAIDGAAKTGFGDLLSLMAIISVNLALINLIPVPALDGGRLLFVAIEAVLRRPIKPSIARAVNTVGFAFLILLMVLVSVHDVYRIIG